jgi:rhodanese-related sulfurtransferase
VAQPVPAIDVDELRRRLASPRAPYVLDVRETWEFVAGHVPSARLIPLGELEDRVREVPRDQPVLVICQVGSRSLAAASYLLSLGYRDVANVDGGTSAWIERGNSVER